MTCIFPRQAIDLFGQYGLADITTIEGRERFGVAVRYPKNSIQHSDGRYGNNKIEEPTEPTRKKLTPRKAWRHYIRSDVYLRIVLWQIG